MINIKESYWWEWPVWILSLLALMIIVGIFTHILLTGFVASGTVELWQVAGFVISVSTILWWAYQNPRINLGDKWA
jgi:ABC-type uncharacterized transport system involved in gliding motility auxiliary subunit